MFHKNFQCIKRSIKCGISFYLSIIFSPYKNIERKQTTKQKPRTKAKRKKGEEERRGILKKKKRKEGKGEGEKRREDTGGEWKSHCQWHQCHSGRSQEGQ